MAATDGKSLDDAAKWRFGHDETRTARAEIAGLNRNCRNRAGTAVNPPDSAQRGVFRATTAETCRAGKGGLPRTSASAEFASGLQEIQRRQIGARLA